MSKTDLWCQQSGEWAEGRVAVGTRGEASAVWEVLFLSRGWLHRGDHLYLLNGVGASPLWGS